MIKPDESALASVVRTALNDPNAALADWTVVPATYRVINRVTAGLYRISGSATAHGQIRSWSVFLKVIEHAAADNSSSFNTSDDPTHWNYWQREALVYRSSLLGDLPPELGVPRCYAVSEPSDDARWLWMEDIKGWPATAWPIARFGQAAQHLGQFQGAYFNRRALPDSAWLSHKWLRAWVPGQAAAAIELVNDPAAWRHRLIQPTLPATSAQAVVRLWEQRERWIDIAEQLPQTVCHLDFWPHNMFARQNTRGDDQTVLLDWSQTGLGAWGEDIANLVLDSVWMLCVDERELKRLEQTALGGYLAGLQQAGWAGDPQLVRLGYALTGALRFGLLAGSLLGQVHDEQQHHELARRYQKPFEQVVAQRAAVIAHALALADEARLLLGQL